MPDITVETGGYTCKECGMYIVEGTFHDHMSYQIEPVDDVVKELREIKVILELIKNQLDIIRHRT
jgi:hypothetical protein